MSTLHKALDILDQIERDARTLGRDAIVLRCQMLRRLLRLIEDGNDGKRS